MSWRTFLIEIAKFRLIAPISRGDDDFYTMHRNRDKMQCARCDIVATLQLQRDMIAA